jgi:precorrin-6Y C5,15-methyltransferase (decarboxylating)
MEALGGPHERVRVAPRADGFDLQGIRAPVAVAIEAGGVGLARGFGLPDAAFAHDGQITKRAIRAMTLAALGPRPGERLWDIGAGSGSISVECPMQCLWAEAAIVRFMQRCGRCCCIGRGW